MALNAPPPYEDITGISRVVMKDNAQETIANYNGNARPGEIVVNLEVDPPTLFVGNNAGFLTQIGTGGGGGDYSNANVAAFLPVYNGNIAANFMFANTANVANITNEFPINIVTNGGETWQFAGNILRGPQGGTWQSSDSTIFLNSPANGYVNISSLNNGNVVSEIFMEHSFIRFFVDNGTPEKNWQMNLDGSFVIPGNIVGNTDQFNSGSLQWVGNSSGDNNGYTTLELIPDDTLTSTDQYVILDPTAPSHIHIRAGGNIDASTAELYLGGELNYVRVIDGTGVRLQNQTRNDTFYNFVAPTDFNTATWFGTPGNYFVQYTAVSPEIGNLAFTFGDDDENRVTVTLDNAETYTLTYGGSSSNLGGGVYRFAVAEAPPTSPSTVTAMDFEIWTTQTNSVTLSSNDFTVDVTDDLRITGSDIFSLRNRSNTDPITIRTDYDGADHVWTFTELGILTTPGNVEVNGDVVVSQDITGTTSSSTLVLRAQPASNTAIQLNNVVDSAIRTVANLEIRTDVSNTAQVWTFDTVGTLTAPGNISAGNVLLSGNVTSVVSVTDPTDFDNLTPINGGRAFVTNANLVAAGNFGAQVSGGGSNTVPVWSDGTNWYIG